MTYRELLKILLEMSSKDMNRLDDTVTVYCRDVDEYYPIVGADIAKDDGVLDDGHLCIYY